MGSIIEGNNSFAQILQGTGENDTITSLGQNDTILGGAGDDLIFPGSGNNLVDGGSGDDTIVYENFGDNASDAVNGGSGTDTLVTDLLVGDNLSGATATSLPAATLPTAPLIPNFPNFNAQVWGSPMRLANIEQVMVTNEGAGGVMLTVGESKAFGFSASLSATGHYADPFDPMNPPGNVPAQDSVVLEAWSYDADAGAVSFDPVFTTIPFVGTFLTGYTPVVPSQINDGVEFDAHAGLFVKDPDFTETDFSFTADDYDTLVDEYNPALFAGGVCAAASGA